MLIHLFIISINMLWLLFGVIYCDWGQSYYFPPILHSIPPMSHRFSLLSHQRFLLFLQHLSNRQLSIHLWPLSISQFSLRLLLFIHPRTHLLLQCTVVVKGWGVVILLQCTVVVKGWGVLILLCLQWSPPLSGLYIFGQHRQAHYSLVCS